MKTLRSFLLALAAIAVVLTSAKPAEAKFADACDLMTVMLPAGDRGIIRTPKEVQSDPGRYVFVVEVFSTDDEPTLLRSKFWYVCMRGVRLDPGWAAQIDLRAPGLVGLGVLGTSITLFEHTEVGHPNSLRGGVYWCDNVEHCLKTAMAHRPEAFVAPASKRP